MVGRLMRRLLMMAAAPVLAAVVSLGWSGTAYAHDVTGIDVNCTEVTVHFSGFPTDGVMVHIAADVAGHGTATGDLLVKGVMTGTVNIAGETSALFGATAAVDVDVTWTFEGPQHVHETANVTCGTATTTTTHATTTTTHPSTTTTTTAPATTTTSVAVGGETTTTVHTGGSTSTTVGTSGTTGTTSTTAVGVSGNETTGGSPGGSAVVAGESVTASGGTSGTSGSSLPFTGSTALPLAAVGATSIAAGALALLRARLARQS